MTLFAYLKSGILALVYAEIINIFFVTLLSFNKVNKLTNDYCISILKDEIPLTIGGGIGQSRLCMYMLQ